MRGKRVFENWKILEKPEYIFPIDVNVEITSYSSLFKLFFKYSGPLLSVGDMFQDHQWMPETWAYTKPYICYVFSSTYIPMIKFNLKIMHRKRLTKIVIK